MQFFKDVIRNPGLESGRFKWWFAAVVFATTSISSMYASTIAKFFTGVDTTLPVVNGLDYSHFSLATQHILFTLVCILTIGILLLSIKRSDFSLNLSNKKKIILATVLGTALFTLLVYIFEMIHPEGAGASKEVFESLKLGKNATRDIVIILSVTVLAPIGEEFLFRGVIFRALRDGLDKIKFIKDKIGTTFIFLFAVAVSSFMFMDNHGGGGQDTQLVMFFVMGVILATAFQYAGSIYVPIMIHSLNNSIAMFNMSRKAVDFQFAFGYTSALITISPLIAFCLVYLIQNLLPRKLVK